MKLRKYQIEAINSAINHIKKGKNGVIVIPTGGGKSWIIAGIVQKLNVKTVVLQPTKEILEQNLDKMKVTGMDIGIFSASMNKKTIGKITFATIGTIINHKEKFKDFDLIIVDECSYVNSKTGQYEEFISSLNKPTIGLTATPFRMKYYRNSFGGDGENVIEARFLTRTRPRVFSKIIHVTQIPDLFDQGFLCPVNYDWKNNYNSKKIKRKGIGFDESALEMYNKIQKITEKIVYQVEKTNAKHVLAFTYFVKEAEEVAYKLNKKGITTAVVSGLTPKDEREQIIKDFKSGVIRCVVNAKIFTMGFDFPELDCVIIGRPTNSLLLYYQMIGRGIRTASGKDSCLIIDLCDNVKKFGDINSFKIEDINGNGLWRLKSNKGYQTGVNIIDGKDMESKLMENAKKKKEGRTGDIVITFGKYKNQPVKFADSGYLEWCVNKFDNGEWKTIFKNELKRRENKPEIKFNF